LTVPSSPLSVRRIAINLRHRCLQDHGFHALGEAEHVHRTVHADLCGLHWVELIGTGDARQARLKISLTSTQGKNKGRGASARTTGSTAMLHVASNPGVDIIDTQFPSAKSAITSANRRSQQGPFLLSRRRRSPLPDRIGQERTIRFPKSFPQRNL